MSNGEAPAGAQPSDTVLTVRNLCVSARKDKTTIPLVRDVSFTVGRGEVVGLVGESGAGKSMTAMAVMGLLGSRDFVVSGEIWLNGVNLLQVRPKELDRIRGNQMGMIFQDPRNSFNPAYTVGNQVSETLVRHGLASRRAARERTIELLASVKIHEPERMIGQYPHTFSGGMLQRAMMAMAVSGRPSLLIADEPTTALDVTVQSEVLTLLDELRADLGMSILFVTHDLGVMARMADRILVMYAGQIVESSRVEDFFRGPSHEYSTALLAAAPKLTREPVPPTGGGDQNPGGPDAGGAR